MQFQDRDNLIGKGIVQVFDNTAREFALQDINRLGDGCWLDGKGNLEWPQGMLTTVNGRKGLNIPFRNKQLEKDEIGAYFIEGLESLGDVLKDHFSDRLADEDNKSTLGYDAPFVYQEGDYAFAGIQPGHYRIIQDELHKIVAKKFCQLPVQLVVWTSKEQLSIEATGKVKKTGEMFATTTGDPVLGPSGPGEKLTPRFPGWFSDCIHIMRAQGVDKEKKVREVRVGWYRTHDRTIDINGTPTKVPCLAKSSCPAESLGEMEEKFRGGFIQLDTQQGISKYVEFLESLGKEKNGE